MEKKRGMAVYWLSFFLINFINYSIQYEVSASYGVIKIPKGENCTLKVNGTILPTLNDKAIGLHYGLIEYECRDHSGFILSKPECYNCGLYCPQNDRILSCRQFGVPFFLGFISAFTFSVTLVILLHTKGYQAVNLLYDKVQSRNNKKREARYVEYFNKFHFKDGPSNAENFELTQQARKKSGAEYPSLTSVAIGTLLATADRTYACDRTLFMHSNGQICDKVRCQDISSYTFTIAIGNTICFNTPNRELMKFSISSTKEVSIYQQLYETSDFEIELESVSQCKQTGICYKENCYKNARYPDFKNMTGVHHYDCIAEGLGCDFMCWHKYACTWYLWWLREIGARASVYRRGYTIWMFELSVDYKNEISKYTFSSELTQHDLNIGKLFTSDSMPINVANVIFADLYRTDYIIRDAFNFYEVEANDINSLTSSKLGDYQISIDNKQIIYKYNEVDCRVYGCKVMCSGPEPSLRVFRSLKHKSRVAEYQVLDDYSLRTYKHLPMSVNLNIGNVEFKNLFVEQAICDFEVMHTFGCIGCNKLPYAVIQAYKIVNRGILPFVSNCTFDRKVLSCGSNINKIVPSSKYQICNLYIPSINKTLILNFTYEFYGELSIQDDIISHDNGFKGIVKSLVNNPNFLDTLTYGAFTFTGIGIVASLILKLSLRAIAFKKAESVSKDISNA